MEQIKIKDVIYKIKELTIDEGLDFEKDKTPKERTFEFVVKCIEEPKMTIEEFKKLPFAVGTLLITKVNEINGITQDFLSPTTDTIES
jgi:hypothetical protein